MSNINKIESDFGCILPAVYKQYIETIETHKLVEFKGSSESREWHLYGASELEKEVEVFGAGKEPFYNCLGLFLKLYFEFIGKSQMISSPSGYIEPERIRGGFVIGEDNGDYLYLDPKEKFSVWIYYHDGSDVKRLSPDFEYFKKYVKEVKF